VSYDGALLLTGHPTGQILKWDVADNRTPAVLANLNAAVTNLAFVAPFTARKATQAVTVVKPAQTGRNYAFTSQLEAELCSETRFDSMLTATGFSRGQLEEAISEFQQPHGDSSSEQELARQNHELWELVHEQRALQRETLQRYIEARTASS
jgi:pre-rRNA-processing protein IPI3